MSRIKLLDVDKYPLTVIGHYAGVCYGKEAPEYTELCDVEDDSVIKRAINCISSGHLRVLESVHVGMELYNISCRVAREWYTHIGGSPMRLQESTRYVNMQDFADNDYYIEPHNMTDEQKGLYRSAMLDIQYFYRKLMAKGVSKEDCALLLPLGLKTKVVVKHNLRNLVDMSHQRMCSRAYWEYRIIFKELREALASVSPQWAWIVENLFKPKCEVIGYCVEKNSCGRVALREARTDYIHKISDV